MLVTILTLTVRITEMANSDGKICPQSLKNDDYDYQEGIKNCVTRKKAHIE